MDDNGPLMRKLATYKAGHVITQIPKAEVMPLLEFYQTTQIDLDELFAQDEQKAIRLYALSGIIASMTEEGIDQFTKALSQKRILGIQLRKAGPNAYEAGFVARNVRLN